MSNAECSMSIRIAPYGIHLKSQTCFASQIFSFCLEFSLVTFSSLVFIYSQQHRQHNNTFLVEKVFLLSNLFEKFHIIGHTAKRKATTKARKKQLKDKKKPKRKSRREWAGGSKAKTKYVDDGKNMTKYSQYLL